MKKLAGRWLNAIAIPAFVGAVLTLGTGCGALKAAANPKVAWAINDPAPMSVVVRRADVAEKTSKEVDRLMTETPANDDSPWLAKVGPDAESVKKDETEIKGSDLYAVPNGPRVVAAEIWAKELAQLEPKKASANPAADAKDAKTATASAAAAPATPATPATPAAAAPAAGSEKCTPGPAKDAKEGAVASNDAAEPTPKESKPKKGGKGKGKGATASNKKGKGKKKDEAVLPPPPDATPAPAAAADSSAATACAPASSSKDSSSKEPVVSTTTTTSASVPTAKYTSMLSAIDPNLGTEWAKVMEKKKAMGDAKAQIAVLEAANDAKGISAADKSANKAKISELEKSVDKLDKEANQLSKEFVPKAKASAQKAPADIRDKFGPSLVNLRQAVADADISNSAAAVRYPMAATTLLDSAKQMAKVYVADVIEEKTGKRPNTQTLQPGVAMEGGSVQVTLNGLSTSDMGKLSVADVTKETAARTSAWAKRALGLLGVIASTKDVLSFEDEVLGALLDGFTAAGWKAPAAAQIPDGGPPGGGGAQQGGGGGSGSLPSAPSLPKI